ncbi:isoflavone reductase family [Fusarium agapanthi]|uniref:Isoflavone reductase family n=1 Tax=Fusarium agapanthi TaxID=1803897 RepID=A0A9P5AZA5_9HYPO|nr:isoflavone reductase family [Fusarium agapanthi]
MNNFNVESLSKVFEGKDAVISLLPILSLEAQAIAIEAAIAAGVKRFIPSEYGSDSTSRWAPFEAKKKYLDYPKSREDAISWTGLITGPFFDWVGRALVAILANTAKTANKLVSVESFTTTQSEALAVLEKATGTEWARTEIPVEEMRAEAFKLLSEGDVANGGAKVIASVVFGKEALEDHSHLGTAQSNKELGLPSETAEETVQWVLKSLE